MINDKNEKILIYSVVALFVILTIVFIGIIWRTSISKVTNSDINKYEEQSFSEKIEAYYRAYLTENLKLNNFENLYSKIDLEFMNDLGYTEKDQIYNYLLDNHYISNNLEIISIASAKNYNTNVYRVTYKAYGNIKYLNIVEEKPYIFNINFDQNNVAALYGNGINSGTYNNELQFIFELTETTNNSVRYKITIINNSVDSYAFDFNSINGAQLRYNGSKYVSASALALTVGNNNTIEPGSSKSFEFLYNIDFNNQANIDGFYFPGVTHGNNKINIEIDF